MKDIRAPWLHFRLAALLALLLGVALLAPAPAFADEVLVFAAASLKNALDDAVAAFAKNRAPVKVSYAASSALAKQIENGAPADLFISADLDWMNELAKRNLVQPATRRNLLGNVLVLIASSDNKTDIDIKPGFPLAKLLGDGHLAMADPDAVPAGKYGKAALEKLGVWSAVERRVARAEDVRAALLYVARKEAPYGVVYRTDAAADKGVRVAGVFPPDTYPPIIYPIALTAASKTPEARELLAFLESAEARPYFEKQGFSLLQP